MAMTLFDIFSRERREVAASIREYEECYRTRRAKLLSFRQNALQEISISHPDAQFALNPIDHRFLILSKARGRLLAGQFADSYHPRLDYVDVTAGAVQRRAAVARFLAEMDHCRGCISSEEVPRLDQAAINLPPSLISLFQSKGYAVTGSVDLEHIIGGSLFLNGELIANSTIWTPKPRGYFSDSLAKALINLPNKVGASNLVRLLVVDRDFGGSGGSTNYDLSFYKTTSISPSMRNLLEFLEEIEICFSVLAKGLNYEDHEYNKRAAQELESPDLDAEDSIESRYLLA